VTRLNLTLNVKLQNYSNKNMTVAYSFYYCYSSVLLYYTTSYYNCKLSSYQNNFESYLHKHSSTNGTLCKRCS